MDPADLIAIFEGISRDVGRTVKALDASVRRSHGERRGQYAVDLVADRIILDALRDAPITIVSEESGVSGKPDANLVVVIDPVDGSTNCAHFLEYWATSICALDRSGMLAAVVMNHATGSVYSAIRDGGAFRDGVALRPSSVRKVEDAMVALSGWPARLLQWQQYRALGCASLALCDLAAGGLDGYIDGGEWHAPWDYLGGLLICREAGAIVVDAHEQELVTPTPSVRRQLIGAATPELMTILRTAVGRR